MRCHSRFLFFVFFFSSIHTPCSEIYTLSLHDALPILFFRVLGALTFGEFGSARRVWKDGMFDNVLGDGLYKDRKSTRLNSSHRCISYAVFCLKKKKKRQTICASATRRGYATTASTQSV